MKKITLIINNSSHIAGFRFHLIQRLKEEYEVSIIAFDDKCRADADNMGISFYSVNANNRSLNILQNLTIVGQIQKILETIKPDKVFTFMLKPNTFGVLAARKAGVKDIYSMVEGAGDPFINTGLKWTLIRTVVCTLYKKAFKYSKKVFFLNKDDRAEYLQRGLVKESQCQLIPGIGVDLEKFSAQPVTNYRTFLMIARMLKTKGVLEYCETARQVRKKYPDAVFNYLGAEGTVKISDIQEYIDDGSVNYLGTTKDVRPYLAQSSLILLLSSYREGMPMSILEAEATGRAIITTDNIGCRDTVVDGYNGFLVKLGDIPQAVEKVCYFIEHPEEVVRMGANSRKFAEEHFDSKSITERTVELISD